MRAQARAKPGARSTTDGCVEPAPCATPAPMRRPPADAATSCNAAIPDRSINADGSIPSLNRATRSVPPASSSGAALSAIAASASALLRGRYSVKPGSERAEVATSPADETSFMASERYGISRPECRSP